jgi:hypothetical protein
MTVNRHFEIDDYELCAPCNVTPEFNPHITKRSQWIMEPNEPHFLRTTFSEHDDGEQRSLLLPIACNSLTVIGLSYFI